MMKSSHFWALSLALVVLALELSAEHALAAKSEASPGKAKTKAPKIKRTIRVKEAAPPPPPAADEAPAASGPGEQNVEMKNVGATNNVDVQPKISIASPPAAAAPQQMQVVPYQPKQAEPIVEEPADEEEGATASPRGASNKLALANTNNNLELATLGSHNRHSQLVGNSNNQLVQAAEGNGNLRQTVMRNSGNTEQVHIDGVGNHKVTRISNAGNTEQQVVAENGAPVAARPLVPANSPLVQINMNDMLERAAAPALLQPLVYGGAPQVVAPQLPPSAAAGFHALSASQQARQQQLQNEIASSAGGLLSSPASRQVAPPYNFWGQQQRPIFMVMPAQFQPQLQPPYAPMLMPQPYFYPIPAPMGHLRDPFEAHHRDREVRKLDRKLHKMRLEEKILRRERRARRRQAKREHREPHRLATTTPKPTVIVVDKEHKPAATTPAPPATTTPKPKVVVVKKEALEEEPEDEEVIEWETVRVPKRRLKSKRSSS